MKNTKNQVICPFESMTPSSDRVRSSSEPSTLNDLKDDLTTVPDDLERRKSLSISTIGRYLSKKITKTIAMTATAIPLNSNPKQKLTPIVHESSIMSHDKDMRRNISIKSVAFWEEEFPKY